MTSAGGQPVSGWFSHATTYLTSHTPPLWTVRKSRKATPLTWNTATQELVSGPTPKKSLWFGNSHRNSSFHGPPEYRYSLENIRNRYALLVEIETNHPSQFGLVAGELTFAHVPNWAAPFREGHGLLPIEFYRNTRGREHSLPNLLPEQYGKQNVGWFTPGTNPTEFGALFVTVGPCPIKCETSQTPDSYHTFHWLLRQVGRPNIVLGGAPSNDTEAVEALCRRTATESAEDHLVMDALINETAINTDREYHNRYAMMMSARASFANPKDHVDDLTLRTLLATSRETVGHYWMWIEQNSTQRYSTFIATPSLQPHEIPRDNVSDLDYLSEQRSSFQSHMWEPIHAAAYIEFAYFPPLQSRTTQPPHLAFFDAYANAVSDNLPPKHYLLRGHSDTDVWFIIVRRPDLFISHAPAFGLKNGLRYDLYHTEKSRWEQYNS